MKPLFNQRTAIRGYLATLSAALLVGCGVQDQQIATSPPLVGIAEVTVKEVSLWDEFSARVAAVESVELRPRVSGYISSVNYVEGGEVRQGDVLFTIDDRSYRAELARATAELKRVQTQAALARSEAQRAKRLVDQNAISAEIWEQRRAAAEQGQSDAQAAQAVVDQARLNVEWTQVRAPINGRAGRALVTAGNLVTTGDDASILTTLVSQDKVYIYFDVDEPTIRRYDEQAQAAQGSSSSSDALPVRVALVGDSGFPHEGQVDFTDNQMSRNTGTITMRAVLDNADRRFRPGLFARVQLQGSDAFRAMLVDNKAIITDQNLKFVYVIDQDDKAQRRDVQLGRTIEGMRIVRSGLQAGDQVVVAGVQKISAPGTRVETQPVEMAPPASVQNAASYN